MTDAEVVTIVRQLKEVKCQSEREKQEALQLFNVQQNVALNEHPPDKTGKDLVVVSH